jgi:hypothetical protein
MGRPLVRQRNSDSGQKANGKRSAHSDSASASASSSESESSCASSCSCSSSALALAFPTELGKEEEKEEEKTEKDDKEEDNVEDSDAHVVEARHIEGALSSSVTAATICESAAVGRGSLELRKPSSASRSDSAYHIDIARQI